MASHGSDNSLCLGGGELSGLSSQEGSLRLLLLPLLPDGSKKMQTMSEIVYCESGLQDKWSPIALCMSGIPSLLLLMRFLPFFSLCRLMQIKDRLHGVVIFSRF